MIAGWQCAVCRTSVDIASAFPWKCPKATPADPHHVLHLITSDIGVGVPAPPTIEVGDNPLVAYGERMAWFAFARANQMTVSACEALAYEVAAGLTVTPFDRSDSLSDALGLDIWVKDETGNLAGSHKARHLVGILLHLRAAETLGMLTERPRLAIASCGNAAVAAATLASSAQWPIDVYVPTWMDDGFGARLDALGATVHRCERRDNDPAGDPAMLRFREAVLAGSIPFTVQGPENAMCLDAGRTIGWEIADQSAAAGVELTRAMIQVGAGTFAACVGAGLGTSVRLDTVQAEGCAPLAAAWERLPMLDQPERYWSQVMKPWVDPESAADGIIDDETYDWIADVAAMVESGGQPVVAPETDILEAHRLAVEAGFDVSVTGSAGLAGVLAARDTMSSGDRIVVVMSGVAR